MSTRDVGFPARSHLRLQAYDYAQSGAYFVTVCTWGRRCVLGYIEEVADADSVGQAPCACRLSRAGNVVETEIGRIAFHHPNASIDKYVIMPNHVHLLVTLRQGQGPCPTVGTIIGGFKARVTKTLRAEGVIGREPLWQPRFHDHIVRGQNDYDRLWRYVDENPIKWNLDRYFEEGA